METPRKISWLLEDFKNFQLLHTGDKYTSLNYIEMKEYFNNIYEDSFTRSELRSIRLFLSELARKLPYSNINKRIDRLVYLGFENDTDILDKLET